MKNDKSMRTVEGVKRNGWRYVRMMALSFIIFPLSFSVCACSEDSEEDNEFDAWQTRNEAVIDQWSSNTSYQKILTYTKDVGSTLTSKDFIYVEVLESGSGTETPLFTDTCRVAYRGHLIPTVSYPEGMVIDETYENKFDWTTAGTSDFSPSTSGLRDGFSTALQHMHVGDHWRVRMPYNLCYGTSDYTGSTTTILGYSNLVFEIAMYDFWHPGETRPSFK